MAELSDDDLAEIIERELPGHRVVKRGVEQAAPDAARAAPTDRPSVDDVSPDIPGMWDESDPVPDNPGHREVADDHEIVFVEPRHPADPLDHGARPKAVIVSGAERRIVGYQG